MEVRYIVGLFGFAVKITKYRLKEEIKWFLYKVLFNYFLKRAYQFEIPKTDFY